jgi:Trk-type K+ transport system membrane component
MREGKAYAAVESGSMIAGALAFFCYACLCTWLMKKRNIRSTVATVSAMVLWFTFAFGAWFLFLR